MSIPVPPLEVDHHRLRKLTDLAWLVNDHDPDRLPAQRVMVNINAVRNKTGLEITTATLVTLLALDLSDAVQQREGAFTTPLYVAEFADEPGAMEQAEREARQTLERFDATIRRTMEEIERHLPASFLDLYYRDPSYVPMH